MMKELGKYIILAGGCIIIIGLIVYFLGNKLRWLGRLPGDIRIERPGFSVYIPLATMLLLSVALSFIVWLVQRFLK